MRRGNYGCKMVTNVTVGMTFTFLPSLFPSIHIRYRVSSFESIIVQYFSFIHLPNYLCRSSYSESTCAMIHSSTRTDGAYHPLVGTDLDSYNSSSSAGEEGSGSGSDGGGGGEASPEEREMTASQAWCLYSSHLLSMWNSRMYEFGAVRACSLFLHGLS